MVRAGPEGEEDRATPSWLDLLGGREIHPINVKVGGFHRVPDRGELAGLRARLEHGLGLAEQVVGWVAGFDFPDHDLAHELVAVASPDHPGEYPMLGSHVHSDRGLDVPAARLLDHVEEYQVAHSTALQARVLARGRYLVGPLARYTLNGPDLAPAAAAAARAAGLGPVCRNPFRSIVVRAVEVVHAFATAIDLIDRYERPDRPAVEIEAGPGVGHGVTEAPRGLLYHRYAVDGDGLLTDAVIVPPTSQNQAAIERDLWHQVESNLDLADDELRHLAELTIRNHDPCISCATHFLDLTVIRS